MNGIHDMGGMQDMGPIEYQKNEPVFHEPWEGRVFAMNLAVRGLSNIRFALEQLPPADYLQMSYYEKWLAVLADRLVKSGRVTESEIDNGTSAPGSAKAAPPLTAAMVPVMVARRGGTSRNLPVKASFREGQKVRARNINPTGHTRLPRYARGRLGTIHRDWGVYVFPDTSTSGQGEKPQHVYSVRFAARELWGDQASSRDFVYIDLWDDYLERA